MVQLLLEAKNLSLSVPVIQPDDRKILSNPTSLLSNLYFVRTQRGMVQILDNMSFKLEPGMRIGLIGANGAGKSTLLRLLAGIYAPTSGSLTVNGSIKGLFDISLGMNPEATGLENIYMRGLQMGMELEEIKKLVPEVIAFSELGEHIKKPFNTFSSGMRLRLAVSISTLIEPDILLLDEWIGMGDARFGEKIKGRMDALFKQSKGLIIASHNNSLLKNLCNRGMVLSHGKVVFWGDVSEALEYYKEDMRQIE